MLDTNAVAALLADESGPWSWYSRHLGAVGLSPIVIFDLRYGIAKSKTAKANAAALELFLDGGIVIAPFDIEDAALAGRLRQRMEANGKPMGPYDLLIAAQALRHGATLVTRDTAFANVKGLRVVDWSA